MRLFPGLSFLLLMPLAAGLAGCAAKAPETVSFPPPASQAAPPPLESPPPAASPRIQPAVPQQSMAAGPFFTQTGLASFYGPAHDGRKTANGSGFDHQDLTAAHRTLAFGTLVRVTNLANGRSVTVEITDRGPHIKSRIIDISLAAARVLRMQKRGVARVTVEAFQQDQPGRR